MRRDQTGRRGWRARVSHVGGPRSLIAGSVVAGIAALSQGWAPGAWAATPEPLTVSSSAPQSTYGQAVTFTAVMSPVEPGAPLPTGSVTFEDGSASLGSVAIDQNNLSRVQFTTSELGGGSHSITALYSGDGYYAPTASPAIVQVVDPAPTTVRAQPASGLDPTVSATLTSNLTQNGIAGETVVFTGPSSTKLCTAVTDSSGLASCKVSAPGALSMLAAKTYAASFAGVPDYQKSSGTGSYSAV